MNKKITKKIKQAMVEKELSQKELGKILHLSQASISKIVRGITDITITHLEKIAQATGKHITYFVKDSYSSSNSVGHVGNNNSGNINLGNLELYYKELLSSLTKIENILSAIDKKQELTLQKLK